MNTKTVFVIGAGASEEVRLPTGTKLKSKIVDLLNIRFDVYKQISGDDLITAALRLKAHNIEEYVRAALRIRDALPLAISVDDFLDSHRENHKMALCAKLAVVRVILEAERNSGLFFEKFGENPKPNYSQLEETWYGSMYKLLRENCAASDLEERLKSVVFIIFNYDRCVEHFLFNALQEFYGLPNSDAADLVRTIPIYHPYGKVDLLPLLQGESGIEFGARLSPEALLKAGENIKTFAEGTNPSDTEILGIKSSIGEATRLIFVGFAFHKLSMQLLSPQEFHNPKVKPVCFATAFGISKSDQEVIAQEIHTILQREVRVSIENIKAAEFFQEYWRSLAF